MISDIFYLQVLEQTYQSSLVRPVVGDPAPVLTRGAHVSGHPQLPQVAQSREWDLVLRKSFLPHSHSRYVDNPRSDHHNPLLLA